MQTREQHIWREKATSNICTAQVLLAVIASMYAIYHGPEGLTAIACHVRKLTCTLKERLAAMGWSVQPRAPFDTITVEVGELRSTLLDRARQNGLNLRNIPSRHGVPSIGISCDETTTEAIIEKLLAVFADSSAPATPRIEITC